jgi:glycosyltransferase involved in cell wall biosynthesis
VLAIGGLIRRRPAASRALHPLPPAPTIGLVIPVIDEAESLPLVLDELPRELLSQVVVVDGGSTDGTPDVARAHGVAVVVELEPGYGRACRVGADVLGTDIIVWIDGDGSDDPAAIATVVQPILSGAVALSLGIRTQLEPGAQHWHQRIGNHFVATLVRLTTGVPLRDIPPMRAIRRDALATLNMRELTYGWPTEMVVKAARAGLPIAQVAVPSRARRGGRSKVSGRLGPSLKAGARMLGVVARYA